MPVSLHRKKWTKILRWFSSELNQNQKLSGGQVFAIMRLATHVYHGKELDRTLGFVQAHPKRDPWITDHAASACSADSETVVPPLPPRKPSLSVLYPRGTIPEHSVRKSSSPSHITESTTYQTMSSKLPVPPPLNPSGLMKQSLQASKIAQTLKNAERQREQERVMQVLKTSSLVTGTNVVNRNRSVSPAGLALSSGSDDSSNSGRRSARAPPLPRRRGAHSEEAITNSGDATASSSEQILQAAPQPPFLGRDFHPQDSSMFKTMATTSSCHTTSRRTPSGHPHSTSRHPPPPVPLKHTSSSFPLSNTVCIPSEHLVSAKANAHGPPPTHPDQKLPRDSHYIPPSPTRTSFSDGSKPPRPSTPHPPPCDESSPTSRVFRSRSLHHTPSPSTPSHTLTSRKRRPESVQVSSSSNTATAQKTTFGSCQDPNGQVMLLQRQFSHLSLQRRSTVSSPSAHHGHANVPHAPVPVPAPLSKLVQTLHGPPGRMLLEKARYKAEAGLSRRGYIGRGGGGESGEALLQAKEQGRSGPGRGWGRGSVSERGRSKSAPGEFDALDVDFRDEDDEDKDGEREIGREDEYESEDEEREKKKWKNEMNERWGGQERDAMKWPVVDGEGWRLL